ncbi:uncharacterized protein C8A04DRAFT_28219 [Dichotomopilus funicola]|uniref:Cofilin n=1 Tax=Dichotomopilus funicola TaxID=1934379 RepID=A0AAN6V3L5_9PEZI|nr:hypothetical protein C8A04DRAFT_28219 [Dichotomopilus funicola]
MPESGIRINPECVTAFAELSKERKHRYIIYKISDDQQEVVIDSIGARDSARELELGWEQLWEEFAQKLKTAKFTWHTGATSERGPRLAVFDVPFSLPGEGDREKIVLISWSSDDAFGSIAGKGKMAYSLAKPVLANAFGSSVIEIQINDEADLNWTNIKNAASKGKGV